MTNLIAFAGKSGAGKDTAAMLAAGLLRGETHPEISDVKFAWPLKKIVSILTLTSMEDLEKPEVKDGLLVGTKLTRRQLINLFADFTKKFLGEHIFTNLAQAKIEELLKEDKTVIISDVRFPHEVDMVKRLGGTVVLLENSSRKSVADPTHVSETLVDSLKPKHTIFHDGETLSELELLVKQVLKEEGLCT